MTDKEKLQKIALLYGERVPECLTFVLDQFFAGSLTSTDYWDIKDSFYPRTGIYWGRVTIRDEADTPVLRGNVIRFTSLRLLVLKKPDHLHATIKLRGRIYSLFKVEDLFAPYYEIEFPTERLLLSVGDTVEIAGQSYRVREMIALRDGNECRARLARL